MLTGPCQAVRLKGHMRRDYNLPFPFTQRLSTINLQPSSESKFVQGLWLFVPAVPCPLQKGKKKPHKPRGKQTKQAFAFEFRGKTTRNKTGIRIHRTTKRMTLSSAAAYFSLP